MARPSRSRAPEVHPSRPTVPAGARPKRRVGDRRPAARATVPAGPGPGASEVVYGYRAGLAVLERRGGDVRAVFVSPAMRAQVVAALGGGRGTRSVLVEDEAALAERAESRHHEGLVVEVAPRRFLSIAELGERLIGSGGTAVALDRVRNPYNIGAILRTAAFFGVDGVLLGAPAPHPALHPDAVRVAEGGAEHLALARTTDLKMSVRRLAELGVGVVGADSRGGADVDSFEWQGPTLLVLGHEREGLSERVRAECRALVSVRGRGTLDSLNVSVAAGVLVAALVRGRPHR